MAHIEFYFQRSNSTSVIHMPMTPSGKIDYRALEKLAEEEM